MKFKEYLQTSDSSNIRTYVTVSAVMFVITWLAFPLGVVSVTAIIGFAFFIMAVFNLYFEYKQFRNLSFPTKEIYQVLKENKNDIEVSNNYASYRAPSGDIIYDRTINGFTNTDFRNYFSIAERQVIRKPFEDAIDSYEKNEAEQIRNIEREAARNRVADIFNINKDSNEKDKLRKRKSSK